MFVGIFSLDCTELLDCEMLWSKSFAHMQMDVYVKFTKMDALDLENIYSVAIVPIACERSGQKA